MSNIYNTVLKEPASGQIVEKKSKFICHMIPVSDEEAALDYIKSMKKEYYDARHNCYAYVIGEDGEIFHSSDDGEPSGTAGRPMLEVITNAGLYNVVCVVTRYFGGVLLGTGGLIRAYSQAVKEALSGASLARVICGYDFSLQCDYVTWGKTEYYFREHNIDIINVDYSDLVSATGVIAADDRDGLLEFVTNVSNGRASVNLGERRAIEL